MENIILQYVPDTWSKNNTQRRFEISIHAEEFKKILISLGSATSKEWLLSNPIILERHQNLYDYGQLLIREQFIVNLLNKTNLYRVRRFIKIKEKYLEQALDYNLDHRRCGIGSIEFKRNITNFQKDEVILIVQVITDTPYAAVIKPDVTADYFIEYIVRLLSH